MGVQDANEFKRTYGAMLAQCLPQGTGMTAGQIQFVESGTPGKLICFTELSGFPLPALTPLPTYLASYRKGKHDDSAAQPQAYQPVRTADPVHPGAVPPVRRRLQAVPARGGRWGVAAQPVGTLRADDRPGLLQHR
nr:hypothetical protein [Pseudomonas sp. BIGb0427]